MSEKADSVATETWPLVSVVIPTYGRNESLLRAVESVAKQTYERIELFVIDDGSADPASRSTFTAESLENIESVTIIQHNENRGANVARNSGIRAATGKYIAFLDDDDYWEETKIAKQVKAFIESGPEVGLVYTGQKAESDEGSTVVGTTAEGDVIEDLFAGKNFGQFSSIMVKKSVIESAGLTDERFPAWQDREWFFRLAQNCHFKSVPEVLTHRQTGGGDSISDRFEQKRDEAYPLFIEKHYPIAREYGLYQARTFVASLRRTLGRSAVRSGEYREARKYFVLSFIANPFYRPVYAHLLASLGGKWTYKTAAAVRQKFKAVRSRVQF